MSPCVSVCLGVCVEGGGSPGGFDCSSPPRMFPTLPCLPCAVGGDSHSCPWLRTSALFKLTTACVVSVREVESVKVRGLSVSLCPTLTCVCPVVRRTTEELQCQCRLAVRVRIHFPIRCLYASHHSQVALCRPQCEACPCSTVGGSIQCTIYRVLCVLCVI